MTSIEWTEATWNPIAGCTVHSPGCTNCYAMRTAARLATIPATAPVYAGLTQPSKAGPVWTGKIAVNDSTMLAPLRRKKPTMYFVNSMSDLFHESVADEVIDRVFAVMALSAPRLLPNGKRWAGHTFQILTKRSDRMRAYLSKHRWHLWAAIGRAIDPNRWASLKPIMGGDCTPLPNVWLGVSVEDQKRADERIPDLLATPAAVRFLSCEPLLGPLDLTGFELPGGEHVLNALSPYTAEQALEDWRDSDEDWEEQFLEEYGFAPGARVGPLHATVDWVIVGGESGPGARPMHPDWARSLRDQCAAADVPFFFKQWGEWKALSGPDGFWPHNTSHHCRLMTDGTRHPRGWSMQRVGKKHADRKLDGVTHDAMPQVQP